MKRIYSMLDLKEGNYYLEYTNIAKCKEFYIVRCNELVDTGGKYNYGTAVYQMFSIFRNAPCATGQYEVTITNNGDDDPHLNGFTIMPSEYETYELTEDEVLRHVVAEII